MENPTRNKEYDDILTELELICHLLKVHGISPNYPEVLESYCRLVMSIQRLRALKQDLIEIEQIEQISLEEALQDYELAVIQYNNGFSTKEQYHTDKTVFTTILQNELHLPKAEVAMMGREGYIHTPDLLERDALEKLLNITTFLDMISNENYDELSIHFILDIEKE